MLKLTDTLEVVRDARCLFRMEKKQKPRKNEFRERVGTISERTFKGESRTDTCKDRIAETQRVRESRRARNERGAVDVPDEPGNRDGEQVRLHHRKPARRERNDRQQLKNNLTS